MGLGNDALDDVRRRVPNQTLGHRGRKDDPLYRARRLLVSASENITDSERVRLRGLCSTPGTPTERSATPGAVEKTLRSIYDIDDAKTGTDTVEQLAEDLQNPGLPPEVNRLGRTIWRWRTQIANWHTARVTNAATEAANTHNGGVSPLGAGLTPAANRLRAFRLICRPVPGSGGAEQRSTTRSGSASTPLGAPTARRECGHNSAATA